MNKTFLKVAIVAGLAIPTVSSAYGLVFPTYNLYGGTTTKKTVTTKTTTTKSNYLGGFANINWGDFGKWGIYTQTNAQKVRAAAEAKAAAAAKAKTAAAAKAKAAKAAANAKIAAAKAKATAAKKVAIAKAEQMRRAKIEASKRAKEAAKRAAIEKERKRLADLHSRGLKDCQNAALTSFKGGSRSFEQANQNCRDNFDKLNAQINEENAGEKEGQFVDQMARYGNAASRIGNHEDMDGFAGGNSTYYNKDKIDAQVSSPMAMSVGSKEYKPYNGDRIEDQNLVSKKDYVEGKDYRSGNYIKSDF